MATETQTSRAYEGIRSILLEGSLCAGTRLSDAMLTEKLKMSKVPIREALSRLSSEGLIEWRPNRGAFVPVYTPEEIIELYEMRTFIDPLAAMHATERANMRDIFGLREFVLLQEEIARKGEKTSPEDSEQHDRLEAALRETDTSFHLELLALSGNRQLNKLGSTVYIIRSLTYNSAPQTWLHGSTMAVSTAHARIVDAMEKRDPQGAAEAAREHAQAAFVKVQEVFQSKARFSDITRIRPRNAKSLEQIREMININSVKLDRTPIR